jgi:predicted lipoprotein with Yx(FWY)xxD motif
MRKAFLSLLPLLAVAVLISACGSSNGSTAETTEVTPAASEESSSSESSGEEGTVKEASNSTVGSTILVDSQGMTLYALSGESRGKFICTSKACLGAWHPLTVSAGAAPSSAASLSTVKRPDGTTQVTYKGEPLYTFVQDTEAGQASGQGIKDVGTWNVIKTSESSAASEPAAEESSGSAASEPATTTEQSSSSGGGGGYAY